MNPRVIQLREAAARRERMGQPITAQAFRNAAFKIEQEEAAMEAKKQELVGMEAA